MCFFKVDMIDLPDMLFEDEFDIRIVLRSDSLPSDDYLNYEIGIAKESRIVIRGLSRNNIEDSILLNEILDDSKIQEIKKLIGNIKLPLIVKETEKFWCDGSSFNIQIITNDFEFETGWSNEDEQQVHKPLRALADFIFFIENEMQNV